LVHKLFIILVDFAAIIWQQRHGTTGSFCAYFTEKQIKVKPQNTTILSLIVFKLIILAEEVMAQAKFGSKTRTKQVPTESLIRLRERLITLPARSSERRQIVDETANFYGVSRDKIYRSLKELDYPSDNYRTDRGQSRIIPKSEMNLYCQLIAAFKFRTMNKKGRHISTQAIIEILEDYGVHTPEKFIQIPKGLLTKSTANRYLKKWGYNHSKLIRESPAARFQAKFSNDVWHFDLSSSDLKQLEEPPEWVEKGQKNPTMMIYGISDDKSGSCYEEYHCVYGENTEAALRFLFNAMSVKSVPGFPFFGIPKIIYMDNGPISKNKIFLRVTALLGIQVLKHLPRGADERKTAARGKGKVERPFRTVKDLHETLYHFHKPKTEAEANLWLLNFLIKHNQKEHREEPHSRIEDWLKNHPPEGIRQMCSWERFSTFAREPEQRKVGLDTRITVNGVIYEVEPNLTGEEVTILPGLFDDQLFIEFDEKGYGPYYPIGKLSTLPTYRKFKKTEAEKTAEFISALAKNLELPRAVLEGNPDLKYNEILNQIPLPPSVPFSDPDPFQEFTYPNAVIAKQAISEHLGQSISTLLPKQRSYIEDLIAETLSKKIIIERISWYFRSSQHLHLIELQIEEKENYVN
jgi:hypothetical protein